MDGYEAQLLFLGDLGPYSLPGERVRDCTFIPFKRDEVALGSDLLLELMTVGRTKMPLASRALDNSQGEGLFEAEFGRDALVMAAFVADILPELTEITVIRLAELQGVFDRTDGGRRTDGEEPGMICHEYREQSDPIAVEYSDRFGWDWPYFGSVDATPLFVSAVVRATMRNPQFLSYEVVQRDGATRTIKECLVRAVAWMQKHIAANPLGLLDAKRASNGCWQVWMDSFDAYHHADGSLARGSIAALEVQVFVHDALLDLADLCALHDLPFDSSMLVQQAGQMNQAILTHYWIPFSEHGSYFAPAVEFFDGEVQPLQVRSANMGLLLNSRVLTNADSSSYVKAIVRQLFDTAGLWCLAGIRTLAANEVRFRPFAYHNGTVWPWQNLWIAEGLRRHDEVGLAELVVSTMRGVVTELNCFPEFVQGTDDIVVRPVEAMAKAATPDGHGNVFQHTLMQPAQKFQGWTTFGMFAADNAGVRGEWSEIA